MILGECIFLASIIPKPKHVRYCFDGLQLKPYYTEFYNVIINRLIDRGLITPEEAEGVRPEDLKITGPAKYYLAGPDEKRFLFFRLLLITLLLFLFGFTLSFIFPPNKIQANENHP